jgi:hypothetical protein
MRKNKEQKLEQSKDKSRAKYTCPEALEVFIKLVNTIPKNAVLRSREEIDKESPPNELPVDSTQAEFQDALAENFKKFFDECFKDFGEGYKEDLMKRFQFENPPKNNWDWSDQIHFFMTANQHYRVLYQLNFYLRSIANFFLICGKMNIRL